MLIESTLHLKKIIQSLFDKLYRIYDNFIKLWEFL